MGRPIVLQNALTGWLMPGVVDAAVRRCGDWCGAEVDGARHPPRGGESAEVGAPASMATRKQARPVDVLVNDVVQLSER